MSLASNALTQPIDFILPVFEALKGCDGSATPQKVVAAIADKYKATEEEQLITLKNGTSKIANQIAWARYYLSKDGWLDTAQRGMWKLNSNGYSRNLDKTEVDGIVKRVLTQVRNTETPGPTQPAEKNLELGEPTETTFREELINTLNALSPAGFEKFCRDFLREFGFSKVDVTGRVGDGGIDGVGVYRLNPFLNTTVVFQCKKYKGAVGSEAIRNFRGAMQQRAEKGIFFTTGVYTKAAQEEAGKIKDNPIALFDGDDIVSLCSEKEFGLKQVKSFEVDIEFFNCIK